jgi:hypothetical protein
MTPGIYSFGTGIYRVGCGTISGKGTADACWQDV